MALTLADAQANLDAALAALQTARSNQSYSVSSQSGGRAASRAQHESLLKEVQYWQQQVAKLERAQSSGGIKTRRVVPL